MPTSNAAKTGISFENLKLAGWVKFEFFGNTMTALLFRMIQSLVQMFFFSSFFFFLSIENELAAENVWPIRGNRISEQDVSFFSSVCKELAN